MKCLYLFIFFSAASFAGNVSVEHVAIDELSHVKDFAFHNDKIFYVPQHQNYLASRILPSSSSSTTNVNGPSLLGHEQGNSDLVIWDVSTGKKLRVIRDRKQTVAQKINFHYVHRSSYAFNHRGDTVAIFYSDGRLELWPLNNKSAQPAVATQIEHTKYSSGTMKFTDDDKLLVLSTNDLQGRLPSGVVAAFDSESGEKLWEEYELTNDAICFSDNQENLLVKNRGFGCEERNIRTGEVVKSFWVNGNCSGSTVHYGNDDSVMVFTPYLFTAWPYAIDATSSRVRHQSEKIFAHVEPESVIGIGTSPSHKYNFIMQRKHMSFVDVNTAEELFSIPLEKQVLPQSVLFSPDESFMVVGSLLFDMETKTMIHDFGVEHGIQFSDDNQFLAVRDPNFRQGVSIWHLTRQ